MKNASRRCLMLLLPLFFGGIASCSSVYPMTLDGIIVSGRDRTPVSAAKVTVNPGSSNESIAGTGKNGSFWVKFFLSSYFREERDGRRWYDTSSPHAERIVVEKDGQQFEIPFPSFPEPESGLDSHATIVAVIDLVEPDDSLDEKP